MLELIITWLCCNIWDESPQLSLLQGWIGFNREASDTDRRNDHLLKPIIVWWAQFIHISYFLSNCHRCIHRYRLSSRFHSTPWNYYLQTEPWQSLAALLWRPCMIVISLLLFLIYEQYTSHQSIPSFFPCYALTVCGGWVPLHYCVTSNSCCGWAGLWQFFLLGYLIPYNLQLFSSKM